MKSKLGSIADFSMASRQNDFLKGKFVLGIKVPNRSTDMYDRETGMQAKIEFAKSKLKLLGRMIFICTKIKISIQVHNRSTDM